MLRRAVQQYASFAVATPLLLGPACTPFVSPKRARKLFQTWIDIMLKSIDLKVKVHDNSSAHSNSEQINGNRGTLYVHLNQQTHLATVLYTLGIDKDFSIITNIEYSLFPFIGWLQVRMGAITIVRQYPEQAKRALKAAVERLRNGDNIGISIEGRRTRDGLLCPYKKGAAVIAIESQCDIVPFMTHGEYLLWPTGSWLVKPGGKVDVVLYPRISTAGLAYEDRDKVTNQLRTLAESEIKKWENENKAYIEEMKSS